MVLIIGGKNQGKLEYSMKHFALKEHEISEEMQLGARAVYALQNIVRKLMTDMEKKSNYDNITKNNTYFDEIGRAIEQNIIHFVDANPEVVLICDEIGCGLVPVDRWERAYREIVGRVCCKLAANAHQVHRVICGIGVVIKDV